MADIADQAADRQALLERQALAMRKDTSNRPRPNGECHECGDDVDGERIFCDAECAQDWEREQERIKRRNMQ